VKATTLNRKLCNDFFDAIERNDLDAVAECYAPGMTMWVNLTGTEMSREENLEVLRNGAGLHRRRTYDDRRINAFDDGFVVQYTTTVVALDGT
jgi:ketosteroid isomerase-like protein